MKKMSGEVSPYLKIVCPLVNVFRPDLAMIFYLRFVGNLAKNMNLFVISVIGSKSNMNP